MLGPDSEIEIGDYFRPNLLTFRKSLSQKEFNKFSSLTSNSERVAFILSYPGPRDLSLEIENVHIKQSEQANLLKDAGNKFFAQGQFRKALETYSNAVLLAPEKDLGIILANRSAALYHLECHDYALMDADEAIRVGYPIELSYKLEERRARCLLGLKRHKDAVEAFKKALKALDNAKISQEKKQKMEADIRVMLAVMNQTIQSNQSTNQSFNKNQRSTTNNLLPKILDVNPLYPALNNCVEIRNNGDDIGRHGIATRDIEPGEIIAVEKPHCAFILAEYRLIHCHRCFKRIFVPMPAACGTCSYVAYCGISCRDADAEMHNKECSLLPALWLSRASITCFLALRAITQQPFEKLMKQKDRLFKSSATFEISTARPYRGKDYERLYTLMTHEDERSMEDIFHRAYMAAWLLRLLKTSSYLPPYAKSPDSVEEKLTETELFIGHLLLHNLQLLQFNSHEISELVKPIGDKNLSRAKSLFIGGGTYPTVALLNHSCNPGVIRYFIGTTIIVRAIRSIAKGEEVTDNYGPIFTNTPIKERQRNMRLQYWFTCTCQACTADWPLLDDIDPTILRFKCETGPSCGNVLPVKAETNEFMIKCTKCGKNTNILKGLKALQDTDALFKVASRNLEEGNHVEALNSYLKILKLLDENLALPIRDYHICQQGVRLCMLHLGNVSLI